MEKLRSVFSCPVATKCEKIENGGCIFPRSVELGRKNIPAYTFDYEKKQLEQIYVSNCKMLIQDKKARKFLALEIFRREGNY